MIQMRNIWYLGVVSKLFALVQAHCLPNRQRRHPDDVNTANPMSLVQIGFFNRSHYLPLRGEHCLMRQL